jgi:hypothetical protein
MTRFLDIALATLLGITLAALLSAGLSGQGMEIAEVLRQLFASF